MNNDDYIYFMYIKSEDPPYFYKENHVYNELIKALNEHEADIHPTYRYKFLLKHPDDWAYVEENSVYIERLPKSIQPEVFIPNMIRKFL